MNIVIKHRNGTTLYEGEAPSLRAAVEKCVRELGLSLTRADLAGATLAHVNLADADLAGVKGLNRYLSTPLHLLREQPGAIRAYTTPPGDGRRWNAAWLGSQSWGVGSAC